MKQAEKRKPRSYKITDNVYLKAMRRAKKEKFPLASLIECIVASYSDNAAYITFPVKSEFM